MWKDYSLFYSSLFTKPPETPINTGLPSGEEWLGTLHHSSPLFTTLHRINAEPLTYAREYCWAATYHEAWSSLMTSAGLQWWLKQGVGNNLGASKNTGWREVKSGEECIATLHPCKSLIYSWLYCICEEWRVFLKEAYYYPAFECHIWWLLTSYMMQAYAVYGVGWCYIECRLRPNMPPASTLYANIRNHLSWCCYTLGEWVIFMLPSRRETATISANGGGWSYTLSERLNVKCLIIRWIDLRKWPLYYTIYSNIYTLLYFLYYT